MVRYFHQRARYLMITLSIIIVNWNAKEVLRDCLESIRQNVVDVSIEIIIVDNNSNDNSQDMIEKEYPQAILIKNLQNFGYGRANNQGIRGAKGKYSLILNPDTLLLPGMFERMYQFLEENPDAAACGPKLLDSHYFPSTPMLYDPTLWQIFAADTFLRKLFPRLCVPHYPEPTIRAPVERISGCCFLARTDALKSVGIFDERIFLFYEEADLFYRLRKNGWTVYYLPDVSIVHLQAESVSQISKFQEELFTRESSLIYFRNRYGTLPSIVLKAFLILSYISYIFLLRINFIFSRKEIYRQKESFYYNLLKIAGKSLQSS